MTTSDRQPPLIVLVDDEPALLSALKRSLHSITADIVLCHSPEDALQFVKNNRPDLVISDHRMPKTTGAQLLAKIADIWPDSQRILLSAYNDFDTVADAFNQGVIHRYINKPWNNEELRFTVLKALESATHEPQPIRRPTERPDAAADKTTVFHGMIAKSPKMLAIFEEIRSAATTNVPIFITGETGTGKELIAKACHKESYRKESPFIAVNCANFNEQLMESQLFGHKKGAFTGASNNQEGLFGACDSGTLFLDEITTIPSPLQAKLLRVIQEREFTPLGSHVVQPFKAQLITASSTTLREAVNRGEFREDLYYRLNVITIALPPLRERGDDALLIARHFLRRLSELEHKSFERFSPQAQDLIRRFHWPGNIRQLENVIHSIVAMNDGAEITELMLQKPLDDDLGSSVDRTSQGAAASPPIPFTNAAGVIRPLWQVEKDAIEQAIEQCDGNIPRAAVMLEINPSTIYRKLQAWKSGKH